MAKVMVDINGNSKIVDEEAGKVYTPKEWEAKLAADRSSKEDLAEGIEPGGADEVGKDSSGILEDTDEE